MDWYVARNGETSGPHSTKEIQDAAATGTLLQSDLVWSQGMPDWVAATEISDFWKPRPPPLPVVFTEPAETPAAVEKTAAISSRTEHNIIVSHWRGENSLPFAYWIMGLGLTAVVMLALTGLTALIPIGGFGPHADGIMMIAFVLLILSLSAWQLVGIWRSATNHHGRGGRRIWAIFAKLAVIVGVLQTGKVSHDVLWPLFSEGAAIAVGIENTPKDQMRLLRDGQELELAGGIPYGTADRFAQMLDSVATIKLVHMNNNGGRIGEAFRIARIIKTRNLDTYTATDCVSACTIGFIAGKNRYLAATGRIGFHSASIGGADHQSMPEINNDIRTALSAIGVPEWFISKALSTPATKVWYPNHSELVSAKVVHTIVDGSQFGWSGVANWRDEGAMEQALSQVPVFAALKKFDPAGYDKFYKSFAGSVASGKSENELIAEANRVVADDIVPRYLTSTPDAALVRYWRSQIAELDYLINAGGDTCVMFLLPHHRKPNFNLTKLVPKALLDEDLAALTQVVRDTATLPAPNQLRDQSDRDLAALVERLEKTHPNMLEVLLEPEKFAFDPSRMCTSLATWYREILSLPQARAAMLLRQLMSDAKAPATQSVRR